MTRALLICIAFALAACSDNTHGAGVNKDCGPGRIYNDADGSCSGK